MNFYETITAAVADIEAHGYDSQARIDDWVRKIEIAGRASLLPESTMREALNRTMQRVYTRLVERGHILAQHKGVEFFKLDRVKPKLRAELDRRIMASAQLIRLNREEAIAKTLQRFSGWSTSIPAGGSGAIDKPEVKADLKKALKSLPFQERRVLIDQGHKFTAALNHIVAVGSGAIAAQWSSHWRQPGYDYREDHKERDGKIFLIRGNWAQDAGLCKPGPDGYADQITAPGEEVFCRCANVFIYSPAGLPPEMLTALGRDKLAAIRKTR